MSQPFDAWGFCRDVLTRGAAIQQDSANLSRSYEEHSSVMDSAARTLCRRLEPHLEVRHSDHADALTPAAVMKMLPATDAHGKSAEHVGIYGRITWDDGDRFCVWVNGELYRHELATVGMFRRLCAALCVVPTGDK